MVREQKAHAFGRTEQRPKAPGEGSQGLARRRAPRCTSDAGARKRGRRPKGPARLRSLTARGQEAPSSAISAERRPVQAARPPHQRAAKASASALRPQRKRSLESRDGEGRPGCPQNSKVLTIGWSLLLSSSDRQAGEHRQDISQCTTSRRRQGSRSVDPKRVQSLRFEGR